MPKKEARQFKQNYLNGFITAELKVTAKTPLLCLIKGATIIDESNDKQYDLFKSEYLHYGNRLTYDKSNNIIWRTKVIKKLNYKGAVKFLSEYNYQEIVGWELPTFNQLKSLNNQLATWRYNFSRSYCYTKTLRKNRSNHIQYSLGRNDTDSGDGEHESVIGVVPLYFTRASYRLIDNRFIGLSRWLVFDAENRLIWITKPSDKTLTYLEAKTYIKQLEFEGLKGWSLPEAREFYSIYDHSIPGLNSLFSGFGRRYFYTKTLRKNRSNHIQYSPSRNDTDSGDGERESVIGVM